MIVSSGDFIARNGSAVLGWTIIGVVALVILISAFWKK